MHTQHWPAAIVAIVFVLYLADVMFRERPAYHRPVAEVPRLAP